MADGALDGNVPNGRQRIRGSEHMMKLETQYLMTLQVFADPPPAVLERTPSGDRQIMRIRGGEFHGDRLQGQVRPNGADWILNRPNGITVLDVRITLETSDEHLIYCQYRGLRHGKKEAIEAIARGEVVDTSDYYMRISLQFETGSEKYYWLNNIIAVGTGDRKPAGPVYYVYEVI
jgi:Protein of unknown function (DUF3237)